MKRPRKAACSRCGIRYPLERKWGDEYGGGFTTYGVAHNLGDACTRPGCDGRIGVPLHLTGELDALRELWRQRGESLRRQHENAKRQNRSELAAYVAGFRVGQATASSEVESTLYGRLRHLEPVPTVTFPQTKADDRNAELVRLGLRIAARLSCEKPRDGEDCGACDACRFEALLLGAPERESESEHGR